MTHVHHGWFSSSFFFCGEREKKKNAAEIATQFTENETGLEERGRTLGSPPASGRPQVADLSRRFGQAATPAQISALSRSNKFGLLVFRMNRSLEK